MLRGVGGKRIKQHRDSLRFSCAGIFPNNYDENGCKASMRRNPGWPFGTSIRFPACLYILNGYHIAVGSCIRWECLRGIICIITHLPFAEYPRSKRTNSGNRLMIWLNDRFLDRPRAAIIVKVSISRRIRRNHQKTVSQSELLSVPG